MVRSGSIVLGMLVLSSCVSHGRVPVDVSPDFRGLDFHPDAAHHVQNVCGAEVGPGPTAAADEHVIPEYGIGVVGITRDEQLIGFVFAYADASETPGTSTEYFFTLEGSGIAPPLDMETVSFRKAAEFQCHGSLPVSSGVDPLGVEQNCTFREAAAWSAASLNVPAQHLTAWIGVTTISYGEKVKMLDAGSPEWELERDKYGAPIGDVGLAWERDAEPQDGVLRFMARGEAERFRGLLAYRSEDNRVSPQMNSVSGVVAMTVEQLCYEDFVVTPSGDDRRIFPLDASTHDFVPHPRQEIAQREFRGVRRALQWRSRFARNHTFAHGRGTVFNVPQDTLCSVEVHPPYAYVTPQAVHQTDGGLRFGPVEVKEARDACDFLR